MTAESTSAADASHAGAGAEVTSDIGQAEANIAQIIEQSQLTFSNDKLVFDQHAAIALSESKQREFERQSVNAETMIHQKNVNALELQGLADNQRLARETAADSRRHADSGFQTRLETISDANLAGMSEVLQELGVAISALAVKLVEAVGEEA